ncbi:hypothetical protein BHU72_08225 [Desulfuribacillus stibiiarsenatis]|uniref:Integrase n=1 Tax=Desulfuribacillus stibiiarsenatis TaxID=1390249 RepID=A0A1E5L3T6_9FIRM|nr:tyrosine-type recombinase/integrase [Desulfuribacillus stibiiarsenatis]OEH84810.1 hypothetical protein BHU72_08225 [Desulfuribacillus stibiiarsenatis]
MADFINQLTKKQQEIFKTLSKQLPNFCEVVITTKFVIEGRLRSTLIHYMRDWHLFFEYYISNVSPNDDLLVNELTVEHMNSIQFDHLMAFEQWQLNERNVTKTTQARRRSSLKVLFQTLHKKNKILNNPTSNYDHLKLNKKGIIALAPNEQVTLLDAIESGFGLTDKQRKSRTALSISRDLALITLLLDTGMRVGEVFILDVNSIDFQNLEITVLGKGAKVRTIAFSEESKSSINAYLHHQQRPRPMSNDPYAIFLNRDGGRLTIRSMQKIVKKYAKAIGKYNITPHKLRSSAGLSLYEATGDIRVVAAQLGHEDIAVTAKKYVEASKHRLHDAIRKRGSIR